MVNLIKNSIMYQLKENDLILDDNIEIVEFGLETLIYKVLHLLINIVIALFFDMVLEIIVFHLFYQKIRTYSGGYHAKSNIVCFFNSMLISFATLLFWTNCSQQSYSLFIIVFLVISFIVIWFFSPIENENKPLDEIEKFVYRNKSRFLLVIEVLITLLFSLFNVEKLALISSTSLFVLANMVLLGIISNIRINREKITQ